MHSVAIHNAGWRQYGTIPPFAAFGMCARNAQIAGIAKWAHCLGLDNLHGLTPAIRFRSVVTLMENFQ